MPFLYKLKVFWPREETRLLIAFFLRFGTPDSGSKFRRYQVFLRYHGASAGMTKGNRLSKRKRNVLKRDDHLYFHHIIVPFKYALLTKREVNMTGYMAKFLFCTLLDFLEVLYFLLVGYTTRLRGLLRDLMHWSSLCSLLRIYEWSTCSKSSTLFTETKSRQMKKERHQCPVILTEQAWSKKGLFILWTSYCGFDSQRFVLLLFSILRVGRPPRHWFISFISFFSFIPASFASTLDVPMPFLISFARNPTSN